MRQIVDRPGYFGIRRAKKIELYDFLFGEGHWSECWQVNDKILPFDQAVAFHDEAYLQYLIAHPEVTQFVIMHGDCIDCDPKDTSCGLNHDPNACPRHLEDVSIRRALKKMGLWFKGSQNNLLCISGECATGCMLAPTAVPFHQPELILTENSAGPCPKWAQPMSVTHFWESNKLIIAE